MLLLLVGISECSKSSESAISEKSIDVNKAKVFVKFGQHRVMLSDD